jgi:signal transduction histidine kinase
MPGPGAISFSPTIVAALAAVAVGFAAFWSNPQRAMNRVFFTSSLHVGAWLTALHLSFNAVDGLLWLKLSCMIGGALPLHVGIIQQTLVSRLEESVGAWLRRNWPWLVVTAALAVVPFTDFFIPPESTPEHRIRGWGYYAYIGLAFGLFAYLFRDAFRTVKSLGGLKRLELQLWLSGACVIAGTILVLMLLTEVTHLAVFVQMQPLVVLAFYSATAFAITTHRIFDARQIMLLALEKFLLIGLVAGAAYAIDLGLAIVLPEPFDFLATTALALWFAGTLNGRLDRMFHFYPQATAARQAAFEAAGRETRADNLERAFLGILKGWGQTDHALILSGDKDSVRGGRIELPGDGAEVRTMRQLRWATPERLVRERATPERAAVAQFLKKHDLGALVIAEGPSLTVFVGVGVAASRRPFTYPQVTQLTELASIVENALERAHFSMKVQHAEQLATVGLLGASVAHEIRNPLVTIKTFVQLLPIRHQDAVFRDKFFRLIGHEVDRIDRLTVQLLELASPRTYVAEAVELHPVLQACLDLVAAKATDRNIRFITEFEASPNVALTDASAAKQVVLNLSFNAIQALEGSTGDRWVRFSTRNVSGGIEVAVSDSGPGIAEEIRLRLFQPFQTTKSTGFGLGLAICRDILANLSATIAVDPFIRGQGATFRVTFPCQPSSS